MDFDIAVKLEVYRVFSDTGRAPLSAEVAAALGAEAAAVRESFLRLRGTRLLWLEPDSGEIRMAPPFSAVPTAFEVTAGGRSYFANCVWDAYGIAAALHRDADVAARCGCCGEPMTMAVQGGAPAAREGVAHFAVPAAAWWDDLVYT